MITSVKNETIKELMKLKQKKYRDETGSFLIEGYHLVEEARKYQCIEKLITTSKNQYKENTIYVSQQVMEKLAFTKNPQPIMAVCKKNDDHRIISDGKRYLLLDRIQDPGNVGTILRSALAFDFDQIIMSNDCVDLYNDKVIRSTQGAIFKVNVCHMDLKEAITSLQKNNIEVYGTCLHNASSIDLYSIKEKMAFVMGNEGQGISQDILDICNHLLYIPIHSIDSLNVAIASSIIMYHFKKERN